MTAPHATNAIALLTKQHRELESAFEAALDASGKERRTLFESCADALMAHVLVEEGYFYPAVKAKRTEDILLESVEEHLSLKRLVADLVALKADDEHFEPKLHVLKEQVEHHHEEEEEKLFPQVKTLLAPHELEALGEQMAAAQVELLKGAPRNRAKNETAAASPLGA